MVVLRRFLAPVLLLGMVLTSNTSLAQAPSGSITNLVVGWTNALWDVSLFEGLQAPVLRMVMDAKVATNYWKCLQAPPPPPVPGSNNALGMSFTSPFIQNGRGRLSGKGTNAMGVSYVKMIWTGNIFNLWDYTNVLDLTNLPATYTANGSVSGVAAGTALMKLTIHTTGALPVSGQNHRLKATDANYVVIDAFRHELRESYANIIAITGQRSLVAGGPNTDAIPDYLGDGTWTLVLNFDAASASAPTRLRGYATVTLNSGAVYPFYFTGRYSPKTGKSTLLLKGVDDETGHGKGATLTVTLVQEQVAGLLGRVAGQIIRLK